MFSKQGTSFLTEGAVSGDAMKKWVILAVALMMVAGVQAKEKKSKGGDESPITKSAFIALEKQKADAVGVVFDQAKAEAAFTAKDKNGDGVLTADEMTTSGKSKKGKKK